MWKIDLKKIVTKQTVSAFAKVLIYTGIVSIVGGGGAYGIFEILKMIFEK